MTQKSKDRIWINAERGLSFDDMQAILPQVEKKYGVYGDNNDITKLTLFQDFYKQKKLAEIFFDETERKFLFDPEQFDMNLCKTFGDGYASFTSGLAMMKHFNPAFTFEHMLYDLGGEMERYINLYH